MLGDQGLTIAFVATITCNIEIHRR